MPDPTTPPATSGDPQPITPAPVTPPTPPAAKPAVAPTPPVMTSDQVLDALTAQLNALEMPNLDSEEAKKWLKDFRIPLASMTVNALVGLVQSRVTDTSDDVLEAMFDKMKPAEINQVLKANLTVLDKIKDQRIREAVLIRATTTTLTSVAASFLMSAFMGVLGVPAVAAMTAAKTS